MQIKRFLVFPHILGDAQFVSATYRLFKTPQADQPEAGSVVTYKGIIKYELSLPVVRNLSIFFLQFRQILYIFSVFNND